MRRAVLLVSLADLHAALGLPESVTLLGVRQDEFGPAGGAVECLIAHPLLRRTAPGCPHERIDLRRVDARLRELAELAR